MPYKNSVRIHCQSRERRESTIGNWSVHEITNNNGVTVVNISTAQFFSYIAVFINTPGLYYTELSRIHR
jgi:hypothetical protein